MLANKLSGAPANPLEHLNISVQRGQRVRSRPIPASKSKSKLQNIHYSTTQNVSLTQKLAFDWAHCFGYVHRFNARDL